MREVSDLKILDGGENKTFRIRQMSATQAERFVIKLIALISDSETTNFELNEILAVIGNKPFERVQELLDSLLSGVCIVRDKLEIQLTPENVDTYVEEMQTLIKLRAEAFRVNNFFQKAGQKGSGESREPLIKRPG